MSRHIRRAAPLVLLALAAARSLPADPDLRAWWATTAALSGDAMQGRDTGSAAYARAAKLVAARFAAAGLKPAGRTATSSSGCRWRSCASRRPR